MRSSLAVAVLLAALPAPARTLVVRSGQSIRAALARASAGDRIEVLPGRYREGSPGDLNALTIRADLVWDGSGSGNCWSANQFSTSVPPQLPGCR